MFFAILLGFATGLRTMTPIALLCWAAYFGWLPVEHTWAFWTAKLVSPLVFTAAALGEYVGDTLPITPSRTEPALLAARVAFGTLCGVIVATALAQPKAGGVLFGAAGALAGAFLGVRCRIGCSRWLGRDLPVALAESALAMVFAAFAVYHIHHEILITDIALRRWH